MLIYDVLRDWSVKERNLSDVKTALQCLATLVPGSQSTSNTFSIQRLLEALERIDVERADRISEAISGSVSSLPQNYDFVPVGYENVPNRSVVADLPFESLVNFAAGWATFENGYYLDQNAMPDPEHFNPDLTNINWQFDNLPGGTIPSVN